MKDEPLNAHEELLKLGIDRVNKLFIKITAEHDALLIRIKEMVPIEDVRPLINWFNGFIMLHPDANIEMILKPFREKHPELFRI